MKNAHKHCCSMRKKSRRTRNDDGGKRQKTFAVSNREKMHRCCCCCCSTTVCLRNKHPSWSNPLQVLFTLAFVCHHRHHHQYPLWFPCLFEIALQIPSPHFASDKHHNLILCKVLLWHESIIISIIISILFAVSLPHFFKISSPHFGGPEWSWSSMFSFSSVLWCSQTGDHPPQDSAK